MQIYQLEWLFTTNKILFDLDRPMFSEVHIFLALKIIQNLSSNWCVLFIEINYLYFD